MAKFYERPSEVRQRKLLKDCYPVSIHPEADNRSGEGDLMNRIIGEREDELHAMAARIEKSFPSGVLKPKFRAAVLELTRHAIDNDELKPVAEPMLYILETLGKHIQQQTTPAPAAKKRGLKK